MSKNTPHQSHKQAQTTTQAQPNSQASQAKQLAQQLWPAVQQAVEPLGFELLEIQVQRGGSREQTIVVRLDRLDEKPVMIDDLSSASRATEELFDQLDPISGEYRLEFESPGAKRPLLTARHFERMLGLRVKVRSPEHQFTAPVVAVAGEQISFDVSGEIVTLPLGSFQGNLAEFPDRHR